MIIVRNLGTQMHEDLMENMHWQVEYWDDRIAQSCPSGIAWCFVTPAFRCVEYVLVRDELRRTGVATRLIKACRQRWPTIKLTGAISPAGEALLASLDLPEEIVI